MWFREFADLVFLGEKAGGKSAAKLARTEMALGHLKNPDIPRHVCHSYHDLLQPALGGLVYWAFRL